MRVGEKEEEREDNNNNNRGRVDRKEMRVW